MSQTPDDKPQHHTTVYVCTNLRISGSSCAGHNSKAVLKALQMRADERALDERVPVRTLVKINPSVCMGYCGEGPNIKIIGGAFYHRVRVEDIDEILDAAERLSRDEDSLG